MNDVELEQQVNKKLNKFLEKKESLRRKDIINDTYIFLLKKLIRYDLVMNTKFANKHEIIYRFIDNDVDRNWIARIKRIKKNPYQTATLLSKYIRYGRAAVNKYDEYRKLQALTNTFEYKQKKYGMTRDEFDDYNNSRAVTFENMISKHGEYKGKEKWQAYCDRQAYAGVKKDYFIEKHGESKGKELWDDMILKKSHTVDGVMHRSGCSYDEAIEYLEIFYEKAATGYSKISQIFFWNLYNQLSDEDQSSCYFMELNKEFGKFDHEYRCYRKYDFALTNKKIIIEYNGDYYHANPKKHKISETVCIHGELMLVSDIWKRDEHKKNMVECLGYKVLYVWDSDIKQGTDDIISKLLNEIYSEDLCYA